ncbi:hypothetical protein NVP1081O_176 [Vibrio phage 1.081.O._10N.286.52.C2]|nr:hypothetical protein NVP1081O_176 [Vibrio phage 1.081.O._10N.286.52.C2]
MNIEEYNAMINLIDNNVRRIGEAIAKHVFDLNGSTMLAMRDTPIKYDSYQYSTDDGTIVMTFATNGSDHTYDINIVNVLTDESVEQQIAFLNILAGVRRDRMVEHINQAMKSKINPSVANCTKCGGKGFLTTPTGCYIKSCPCRRK